MVNNAIVGLEIMPKGNLAMEQIASLRACMTANLIAAGALITSAMAAPITLSEGFNNKPAEDVSFQQIVNGDDPSLAASFGVEPDILTTPLIDEIRTGSALTAALEEETPETFSGPDSFDLGLNDNDAFALELVADPDLNVQTFSTPVPAAAPLFILGLAGLAYARKRRTR